MFEDALVWGEKVHLCFLCTVHINKKKTKKGGSDYSSECLYYIDVHIWKFLTISLKQSLKESSSKSFFRKPKMVRLWHCSKDSFTWTVFGPPMALNSFHHYCFWLIYHNNIVYIRGRGWGTQQADFIFEY